MKKINKNIAIVGYGYVGKAMSEFFKNHYHVGVYDVVDVDLKDGLEKYTKDQVNKSDLVLVCVPTQQKENGRCDTSLVEETVSWIESKLIIIKSTVEVGTTKKLKKSTGKNLVFSPEYCGESTYWSPYLWDREVKQTPFFIFGGDKNDTAKCVDSYLPVTGPVKTYRQTDSTSAEMAKYMENSFYASKITFCYEMANICKLSGLDYNEVRELWLLDPRINPMHTAVFADNIKAYGGKCLGKDISALKSYAKDVLGYDADLLQEVINSNERIGKFRDAQNTSDSSSTKHSDNNPCGANCKKCS